MIDRNIEEALDLALMKIEMMRSTPAAVSMFATSFAVMGSRAEALRSWRE